MDSNPLIYNDSFLALDSDGNPHISYYKDAALGSDSGSLVYTYWTGSAWNTENVDNTNYGAGPITLDSSGNPHISYLTFHPSDPAHYRDVIYASRIESTTTVSLSTMVGIVMIMLVVVVVVTSLIFYFKKRKR